MIEVGCWAHARRYFVKAEEQEPKLAAEAIARIRELYALERQAKEAGLDAEQVRALRRAESIPRLERAAGLDGCDAAKGARQRAARAGHRLLALELDSAHALLRGRPLGHRQQRRGARVRTIAVGRKNWIFFGNERGGKTAAVMYSLIATCKEHDVDPRTYLRDVLLRIGKVADVRELTPYGWKQKWAPVVEAHRASIIERLALKIAR
ncbi:MAG: transposase [Planctomycetes bacterium]|nr:transposase [Planctomycetota bacterium]